MLSDNLKEIDAKDATIVCASKYVGAESIRKMYNLGIKNMGENRVQAFLGKYDELKDLDIIWHFIGHLQTNKVKDVINKIEYLHSLDSIKLANEIEKYSMKKIKCFIEINSGEESKSGIDYSEALNFYNELKKYSKIEVIGFMTMAPNTTDEKIIKGVFMRLKDFKDSIDPNLKLSMGMSNDYKIALECGATHIRLGSILWKGEY
ncbi:MAG: YggS family pyridoxal phosphate-dependent enzyme [bacterium]|nr:YggS family pyridoxal phosphate-dependent enzyme [bacterium]